MIMLIYDLTTIIAINVLFIYQFYYVYDCINDTDSHDYTNDNFQRSDEERLLPIEKKFEVGIIFHS